MSKAEKFIQDCTLSCSNMIIPTEYGCVDIFQPWLTPDQARKAVEIEKEEVIKRACEYLDGIIEILNDRGHGLKKERIIGGLKQSMTNE